MTQYTGIVKDGVIVLDGDQRPPEGARVVVQAVDEAEPQPLAEIFRDLAGKAQGLPPDFAAQHDHYLHGTDKR